MAFNLDGNMNCWLPWKTSKNDSIILQQIIIITSQIEYPETPDTRVTKTRQQQQPQQQQQQQPQQHQQQQQRRNTNSNMNKDSHSNKTCAIAELVKYKMRNMKQHTTYHQTYMWGGYDIFNERIE